MSAAQRIASSTACTHLAWDGFYTVQKAPGLLNDKPLLRVHSPGGIAGDYAVGLASFGPGLDNTGVTGNVVLANDGTGTTSDGCEAFTNAAAMAGKIALVDRGTCGFTIKVKNAQNAGAIAAIVVDNVASCAPDGLGGVDPTITIPSVRVTQSDGNLIRANLGSGVNVTLLRDPSLLAGGDAAGRVLMYSPSPYQPGSSVSHWDTSADPDLLMEPALNNGLSSDVDLTKWAFTDIGWFNELLSADAPRVEATRLLGNSPNPFGPSTLIRFALEREQDVSLDVYDLNGRLVTSLRHAHMTGGQHAVSWDGRDRQGQQAPAGVYVYRLKAGEEIESRPMVLVR
jgi:hypothetical protein